MSDCKAQSCQCGEGPVLVFACSGAADVGCIADGAARKMNAETDAMMFCTVGIGGRVSGIMKTTEAARDILALDGCPLDCVKNTLEQAGFTSYKHLRVTDLDMEKGKSPATDEAVEKVARRGVEMLDLG